MANNKFLAWTSFILFVLSVGVILLFVSLASVISDQFENPGILILVVGAFSLLATVMGFLSFKAPQAKVGGIGGLIILLLVLFVIPVGRQTTFTAPEPEISYQEQPAHTGIAELDLVIDTILAGTPEEQLALLQFSELACTHADGLGGPPKCMQGEAEGTRVEVFPLLGSEGHHSRKNEMDDWPGLGAANVYAAYRVSPRAYSDANYPAGEYAIVFLTEQEEYLVIVQVSDGKIVRIDSKVGNPPVIDFERDASEIILKPQN